MTDDPRARILGTTGTQRAEERFVMSPNLMEWSSEILFGEVWNDARLDVRTRRLLTITALLAAGENQALAHHVKGGIAAGDMDQADIAALAEHLMWYLGLPAASRLLKALENSMSGGENT